MLVTSDRRVLPTRHPLRRLSRRLVRRSLWSHQDHRCCLDMGHRRRYPPMLRPECQMDVLRPHPQRYRNRHPKRHHPRLGHRNRQPHVPRPIRLDRIHPQHFWGRRRLLDRIRHLLLRAKRVLLHLALPNRFPNRAAYLPLLRGMGHARIPSLARQGRARGRSPIHPGSSTRRR